MIDPDEANRAYTAAHAIAGFQLADIAFGVLVGNGILPKSDAERLLTQAIAGNRSRNHRFSVTLGLTDQQLKFVTAICQPLPVEKRSVFLSCMVAHLQIRDLLHHPSDEDLEAACRSALSGLMQGSAAA
jgi:hypothetical protein